MAVVAAKLPIVVKLVVEVVGTLLTSGFAASGDGAVVAADDDNSSDDGMPMLAFPPGVPNILPPADGWLREGGVSSCDADQQ